MDGKGIIVDMRIFMNGDIILLPAFLAIFL